MPSALHGLTITEARGLLDRREASARELTQAHLDRIRELDPRVGAFVSVTPDEALQQADLADAAIARGEAGQLAGIPMQIKDNMCTRGVATTCSSRMLERFVPPYDATVVERLRNGLAVMLGKGNMDEFAMGSSTENSAFFPTRNPWDVHRVPGGSSGGPAAAVAAGESVYALGSDTGGSIRQPASLCGIVGMKPTYGLVSRYGLVAFASSLDQIGPLTRDVTDCAIVLNAIAGGDPRDSTSIPMEPPDYTAALTGDVRGLRVGVPREYYAEGIDPAVADTLRQALAKLESLGAVVEETSLPHTALRAGGLLHPGAIGGVGKPGPLRRREVRLLGAGRGRHVGGHGADQAAGLRAGGEAANHARHLRPLGRLLRRLLPQGAEGANAHRPRVPRRLPEVRRAGHAHLAHGRVPAGRQGGGPGADVPQRRLHHTDQHRGRAGDVAACRVRGRAAGGHADHRAAAGRGDDPAHGPRLRAGDGVAHDEA